MISDFKVFSNNTFEINQFRYIVSLIAILRYKEKTQLFLICNFLFLVKESWALTDA